MSNKRKGTGTAKDMAPRGRRGTPESEDYKVGYKKPPRHSRFKPGQSGNLRGAPKRPLTLAAKVQKVVGRKIPVLERGRRKLVAADEAMLHVYLERALKGDVKAGAFLISVIARFEPAQAEADKANPEVLSDDDVAIVTRLLGKTKEN
jgi:hypothetical protein